MKKSATDLRANLYATLAHVAATGVPVEVDRGGVRLRIIRVGTSAAKRRAPRTLPDLIAGDPDDLIHLEWPWTQGRDL